MIDTNPIEWTKCFIKSISDLEIRDILGIKQIFKTYLICLLYFHIKDKFRQLKYIKEYNQFQKGV